MNRPGILRYSIFALSVIIIVFAWIGSQRQFSFNFDSQNKIYQAHSLVQNGFQSEALVYAGQDIDSEGLFDPIPHSVVLKDGRKVGAFPLAFSFLATPFILIDNQFGYGLELSALLSLLPLLGIWALLLYWRLPPLLLIMAFWGNFLWLQSFDFSEYLLATFLSFLGYTLSLHERYRQKGDFHHLIAGMIFGLAVFFRHEAIVASASVIGALLFLQLSGQKPPANQMRRARFFVAGSISVLFLWLTSNQLDYGHFLGPRFLANQATQFQGIAETLRRYMVLYFGGGLKFGLFVFMPLLLIPLFLPVLRFFQRRGEEEGRSFSERITLVATVLYLAVIPLIVPNDGAGGFGPRYLIFAVLPGFILIKNWMERRPSSKTKYLVLFFTVISLPLPVLLHQVQEQGTAQQKAVYSDYAKIRADIWIFPNQSLYYYAGLDTVRYESYIASTDAGLLDLTKRLHSARDGKSIAIVTLNEQVARSAEANLAGKDSELARATLMIIRSAQRDVAMILKRYPDAVHIQGKQADVILLAPATKRQ